MSMHTTEAPSFEQTGLVRSWPFVTGGLVALTHDYWSSEERSHRPGGEDWVQTDSTGRTFFFSGWKTSGLLIQRGLITIEVMEEHPDGTALFVVDTQRELGTSAQSRIDEPAEEIDGSVDELLSKTLTRDLNTILVNLPEALAAKFRQFSELPDNWDSYGAPSIDEDALGQSAYIVQLGVELNLPLPAIAPGSDAGIGIEWSTDDGELYIDIAPENETTYALSKYGQEIEGTLENRGQISRILESLVR